MSITGSPMDHGGGDHDDGRATPDGTPPQDWDQQFTAIVSGISGGMRWEVTAGDLDEAAEHTPPRVTRAPDDIWRTALPDTADDRRLRRELRRAERARDLAAFQQSQEELAAARAADTEHYEPPPPPPIPRPTQRTVGAIILIVVGLAMVISPALFAILLPARFELIAVGGVGMLFGGGWLLVSRLRRHHGPGDGAQV